MISLFGLGWSVVDQPSINNRDNRQIHPCFFLIHPGLSPVFYITLKSYLIDKSSFRVLVKSFNTLGKVVKITCGKTALREKRVSFD